LKSIRFTPALFVVVLLALFFGISLIFRIALPHDTVFTGDWIKFTSIDAYYQMRIVDNMVYNFPNVTEWDPYLIYPSASGYGNIHFFNWLLAGITWIIGLGSPTPQTINTVGVYFPTILAALTIIPTYFIGKMLFNRWAGVFAAGLVAVMPGEFLGRSLLGFTDTHIMETLLTTTLLAFFIAAIKTAGERQLTFNHLRQIDKKVIIGPLVLSLLAGIFLGLYLITWMGGMLFVFIIAVYVLVQFIINHLKGKLSDHLAICSFVVFLPALIIFVPFSTFKDLSIAIIGATVLPIVLVLISHFLNFKNLKRVYFPAVIIILGALVFGAIQLIAPEMIQSSIQKLQMVFFPGGPGAATTIEMQPSISLDAPFPTAWLWGTYTTDFFFIGPVLLFDDASWIAGLKWFPGFAFVPILLSVWLYRKRKSQIMSNTLYAVIIWGVLLALIIWLWFIAPAEWKLWFPGFGVIGFFILIWQFIKQGGNNQPMLLFFVWTIIILIATLVQTRFNYYFIINVALLSGYFSYLIIWWAGLRKLTPKTTEETTDQLEKTKAKKNKKRREQTGLPIYHINIIVAILVVFALAYSFNIVKSKDTAAEPQFAPSDAWQESLLWLKDNTPEPFGDPDAYYSLFEQPANIVDAYPEEAYAVTSWWDYGYWITRTGHRIPSANPSQASVPIQNVASLLLESDITKIHEKLDDLNTSYVMIDYPLVRYNKKLHAILTWGGKSRNDFIDYYYLSQEDKSGWIQVWKPEYYQTLIVRLFNFDAEEVTEVLPVVLTYVDKTNQEGEHYREVTSFQQFNSYDDAVNYMESQESGNHVIVGISPFISPVQLEKIDGFNMVYGSSQLVDEENIDEVSEVKIFEYNSSD
jgi:oligosaccharyl transferase (archaeosortase A-associated)